MIKFLTASADTFITNRILFNKFRATDSNLGRSSTLDIFKLFNENKISGTSEPIELSRALIKFDVSSLRDITSSFLDISHSSFSCILQMKDVYGGQTTPSNFDLILFPLSRSFDEGQGRDVVQFEDLDVANWITASYTSQANLWAATGSNKQGLLGASDIDIISSGTLSGSSGLINFFVTQKFTDGDEDLQMDVTTLVSATLVGMLPDHGFRISFSGTQETDNQTRFVKRFASRHVSDFTFRPRIMVTFDDSIEDNHENFFFDISGSIFLRNYHQGQLADIVSGSGLTSITGNNSIILKLTSGTFTHIVTGSQMKFGSNFMTGVYSASFAIPTVQTVLSGEIIAAGSATFTEFWESLDRKVGYHTGTFVIKSLERNAFDASSRNLFLSMINMRDVYKRFEKVRFRIFAEDRDRPIKYSKIPIENKGIILKKSYYRVRDSKTGKIVIQFETVKNATKLSTDSFGMYFDFYMDSLFPGSSYTFDILVDERGVKSVYQMNSIFRVED